jgi:hypothetical protein
LSPSAYLRSLLGRHERAVAAGDDPLPSLAEVPLHVLSEVSRVARRGAAGGPITAGAPPPARLETGWKNRRHVT